MGGESNAGSVPDDVRDDALVFAGLAAVPASRMPPAALCARFNASAGNMDAADE